jgi:hypothetical protein
VGPRVFRERPSCEERFKCNNELLVSNELMIADPPRADIELELRSS